MVEQSHPSMVFFKKQRAPNVETRFAEWSYMEDTGRRGQAISRKQIRHLEKLPSLSPSISYSVVAIPYFLMKFNSVAGSYSKKTSSKGCNGEVQIWQLTSRLRNISEFHKECHSLVLGLQRSFWCKAQGKNQANSLPGRWRGWEKGE